MALVRKLLECVLDWFLQFNKNDDKLENIQKRWSKSVNQAWE